MAQDNKTSSQLARYVGAFFDELIRGGVRDVVISPGSRSTPLAIMAHASSLNTYVDVDERGAAFFSLGIAKATGRAVAVVCTSGTALANYYPAVLEAESSRVPLLVLSGDRPARLQKVGAPQTCDQLHIFGSHVRRFWNMPEPAGRPEDQANSDTYLAKYARQVAREALAAAAPHSLTSGPVHINFPFDEPLLPNWQVEDAFTCARCAGHDQLPLIIEGQTQLTAVQATQFSKLLAEKRVIALCGEGTLGNFNAQDPFCWQGQDARAQNLALWAAQFDIPLLADPLSQLRSYNFASVIDGYDNIFRRDTCPDFDVVVRFGRYPVSKRVFKMLETKAHLQIVIDPLETRDFNSATSTLVKLTPQNFIESFVCPGSSQPEGGNYAQVAEGAQAAENTPASQGSQADKAPMTSPYIQKWRAANEKERALVASAEAASFVETCNAQGCTTEEVPLEGAYVRAMLDLIPGKSLLFCANSMPIRAIDSFFAGYSNSKPITILANRGLNGIDGTVSSALGAAQAYNQTYFLTGDLTLLHDLNALALHGEFALRAKEGARIPCVTIILFNNNGGGIFELLPQKSQDRYFERLFSTPQAINFEAAAQTFGLLYKKAKNLADFREILSNWNGKPGIKLVEIPFNLEGLATRFSTFQ